MPRPKQFDPDAALDKAMDLFWRQGYDATSTTDLLRHLGISRASLYATFGSKHELYVKALERYMAGGRGGTPAEILARPGPALDAVRALVESYATVPVRDQPRGCLVVNATVECGDADDDVARRLDANRAGLEGALFTTLLRARAQGEVDTDADPRALARFLVVVLSGMQVLARAGDAAPLADAARTAMAALH